jgi:MFS transporter
VMAVLFVSHGLTSPWAFEAFIFGTFFLASAGASAAYLTVSEVFPMETRALAIAFFYAIGTGLGGIIGPLLFGHLIATNSRNWVMVAFLIGAGVMALGGIAEIFLGVHAEGEQLEDIAKPLTAEEAETGKLAGEDGGGKQPEQQPQEKKPEEEPQRWRERGERRTQRERTGARRYRPGPGAGETFYSPGMLGTSFHSRQASQGLLDREIDAIADALASGGTLSRDDLAARVGARRWGPGRFRYALREAESEGRVRRISRTMYGRAEDS